MKVTGENKGLLYRPELDGLRTVAVVAVILFHSNLSVDAKPVFSGGFIGVDVFFVLSGYLISLIILSELDKNQFRLAGFYERRARRIFPALFSVIFVCLALSWAYLLPGAFKAYSGSALSSVFFVSNFWFWQTDGYFAAASVNKPLLHTWSLSVEEQFYIVLPLTLLLAHRLNLKLWLRLCVFTIVFCASFAFSFWDDLASDGSNFYLIHARAWEFLCGFILATLRFNLTAQKSSRADDYLTGLGLILILYASVTFTKATHHPGPLTLIPVIGAMLVIRFSSASGLFSSFLRLKPIVFLGLISYSLYLWHFPVFVFAEHILGSSTASPLVVLLLVLVSIILATISYYLIEQPFRSSIGVSTKAFYWGAVLVASLIIFAHSVVYSKEGMPRRLGDLQFMYEQAKPFSNRLIQNDRPCFSRGLNDLCEFKNDRATSDVILIGDSHAQTFGNPLLDAADRYQYNLIDASFVGCLNIYGTRRLVNGVVRANCSVRSLRVKKFIEQRPPSTIIYAGRFPTIFEGSVFDNKEGGVERPLRTFELQVNPHYIKRQTTVIALFHEMIDSWVAAGHKVVLVYPIPEVGWHVPMEIKRRLASSALNTQLQDFKKLSVTTGYEVYRERSYKTNEILDGVKENPNILRVRPERFFCSAETDRCVTHSETEIFYYDDDHLSLSGATLLVTKILSSMAKNNFFGNTAEIKNTNPSKK